jgi:hypothetical protein
VIHTCSVAARWQLRRGKRKVGRGKLVLISATWASLPTFSRRPYRYPYSSPHTRTDGDSGDRGARQRPVLRFPLLRDPQLEPNGQGCGLPGMGKPWLQHNTARVVGKHWSLRGTDLCQHHSGKGDHAHPGMSILSVPLAPIALPHPICLVA